MPMLSQGTGLANGAGCKVGTGLRRGTGLTLGEGSGGVAPASTLLTGLEHWYPLDETSGQRNDAHGSRHLTDNNTVGNTTGKKGNAADFVTANSEYLHNATSADGDFPFGPKDFSFAAWFKRDIAQAQIVMAHFDSSNDFQVIQFGGGQIYFYAYNTGGSAKSVVLGTANDLNWHFLYGQYDHSALEITGSLDGNSLVTPVAITGTLKNGSADGRPFQIGAKNNSSGGTNEWDGAIDEVAMWSRTLTTDEIAELYNSGDGIAYTDL